MLIMSLQMFYVFTEFNKTHWNEEGEKKTIHYNTGLEMLITDISELLMSMHLLITRLKCENG